MKDILKKQLVFISILYAISRLLWELVPISLVPCSLKIIIDDFIGPMALMSIVFYIFIQIGWRIPIIKIITQLLFGTKPYIQGTWQGQLKYEKDGHETEKTVYLVIRQPDGYSINIWLLTNERTSSSEFVDIILHEGVQRIFYTYKTEDSPKNKEKNPLHSGFCQLDIGNNSLNGTYYTSRKTTGELFFDKRRKKITTHYEVAKKMFGAL
jgi:hypothetical protein